MKGTHLRLYTYENRKHGGALLYEWLLERAKQLGVHGGSAFRAIAGFGRHGRLHEQHFFELAGEMPVLVEFVLADSEADALLDLLRREDIHVFYTRVATEFGVTDSASADAATTAERKD
jgi:PII-like signaling protein